MCVNRARSLIIRCIIVSNIVWTNCFHFICCILLCSASFLRIWFGNASTSSAQMALLCCNDALQSINSGNIGAASVCFYFSSPDWFVLLLFARVADRSCAVTLRTHATTITHACVLRERCGSLCKRFLHVQKQCQLHDGVRRSFRVSTLFGRWTLLAIALDITLRSLPSRFDYVLVSFLLILWLLFQWLMIFDVVCVVVFLGVIDVGLCVRSSQAPVSTWQRGFRSELSNSALIRWQCDRWSLRSSLWQENSTHKHHHSTVLELLRMNRTM